MFSKMNIALNSEIQINKNLKKRVKASIKNLMNTYCILKLTYDFNDRVYYILIVDFFQFYFVSWQYKSTGWRSFDKLGEF